MSTSIIEEKYHQSTPKYGRNATTTGAGSGGIIRAMDRGKSYNRIQAVRKSRGLTQEQLADLMDGVGLESVRRHERGQDLGCVNRLQEYADVLGVDVGALVSDVAAQALESTGGADRALFIEAVAKATRTNRESGLGLDDEALAAMAFSFYKGASSA